MSAGSSAVIIPPRGGRRLGRKFPPSRLMIGSTQRQGIVIEPRRYPCHFMAGVNFWNKKETDLRDRTELPAKHALDQEPPSRREISHNKPGFRVANTRGGTHENEPRDRHGEKAPIPGEISWGCLPIVVRAVCAKRTPLR